VGKVKLAIFLVYTFYIIRLGYLAPSLIWSGLKGDPRSNAKILAISRLVSLSGHENVVNSIAHGARVITCY
jgi:hypothetical protein